MPWENRFEVKTASQSNAYRQLISKESMRRRNESKILQRYANSRFRDELAGPPGQIAPHWNGHIVDPLSGSLAPVSQPRTNQHSPSIVPLAETVPHSSHSALRAQCKSTVLDEGYHASTGFPIAAEYRTSFSPSASVRSEKFWEFNPDARTRLAASNRARSTTAQREMLQRRLSLVTLDASRSVSSAAHRIRTDDIGDASVAVADIAPATKQNGDPPPEATKKFGLRSFGLAARPVSAESAPLLAEIQSRARQVFERPPLPRYVVQARQLHQNDIEHRSDEAFRAISTQPPEPSTTPFSQEVAEERIKRLEHELAATLANRDVVASKLRELCGMMEHTTK